MAPPKRVEAAPFFLPSFDFNIDCFQKGAPKSRRGKVFS
jgi:hypothetical protein